MTAGRKFGRISHESARLSSRRTTDHEEAVVYRTILANFAHALLLAGLVALCVHLPLATSASIRQLVEVVDFSGASVSPDGRMVAFRTEQASIERNTYDTVWYVQPLDGASPPRRLGDGGEPLRHGGLSRPEIAKWSPDGQWIFYRGVFDGRIDVWRAAVDGSRTEPVTRDPANVREFALSKDGALLMYSVGPTREEVVNAELAEYDRGVLMDRSLPLGDNVFRSGYHEGRLATQRLFDQGGLDHLPLLQQAPARWKAIDLSTGDRTDLSRAEVPESPLVPSDVHVQRGEPWKLVLDTATGRIAVLSRTGDGTGLIEQPHVELSMLEALDTHRAITCTAQLCTGKPITDVVWRPGSDEIVFTVTDPDRGLGQSLYRWNVVTGDVHPVAESRGELGGGGRWRPGPCAVASDALACIASEADRPPRLERIDLNSGKRQVLFEPNSALDLDMKASARAHQITWTDARGMTYTGQFFRAAPVLSGHDTAPPLFIVHYRCSGFLRGGVGDEWPLATLARHGIAALCINSAPYRSDAVERYENGRSAIESAVDFLASRGEADPARVGIGGLSMGAEVALWTAMHSRVPRAVSVSTPVISPNLLFLYSLWESVHFSRLDKYWQLGGMNNTPQRWQRISPSFAPERLRAPVLMQMSEQEYRFSLDYSIDMVRARQADVYVFPHEPHQKFMPRHKLAVYERNLDWFRFWLLGLEEGDVLKAGQYERWRAMRTHYSGLYAP